MELIFRRLQAVLYALVSDEDLPGTFNKIDLLGMGNLRMDWF